MPTTIPSLTPYADDAPQRGTRATFRDLADKKVTHDYVLVPQANIAIVAANQLAAEVMANAEAAQGSEDGADAAKKAAQTAQLASETASNATAWDSGKIGGYAAGDVVYYTDGHSYRSKIAQAEGSVEPVSNATYWCKLGMLYDTPINNIGIPGEAGFGVGICPGGHAPTGMNVIAGTTTWGHDNYGNYQYEEGSICCYEPVHYVKWGNGSNGLPVNVPDVKPWDYFATEVEANAYGYGIPAAFKSGGEVKYGVFVDKYKCSKNAWGTGFVASSIKNGLPISCHADHNPIADLTACAGNYYYQSINAVHARDGVDGAINSSSIWFVKSIQINAMLATLSMAHGQASSSTTNCAYYHATNNFPKGCNNNALGDTDDGTVSYTSDGYSNCGKTGSGVPFAKTTHNGQNCGVADLNGLMYEVTIGVTCIAETKTITAVTQADPCQLTVAGHGKSTGDYCQVAGVTGTAEINDKIYTLTVVDADNYTLDGVDSAEFATYESGGTATSGNFYKAKESVEMSAFTPGNSSATDHWGATGIAVMMDEYDMVFETGYPSNGFSQRMGSGANQVLSPDLAGNGAVLKSLGLPQDTDGVDTSGTNLFGKDYFYQYIRNEFCVLSGGSWNNYSYAGVWGSTWSSGRTNSNYTVSFRAACYPV